MIYVIRKTLYLLIICCIKLFFSDKTKLNQEASQFRMAKETLFISKGDRDSNIKLYPELNGLHQEVRTDYCISNLMIFHVKMRISETRHIFISDFLSFLGQKTY